MSSPAQKRVVLFHSDRAVPANATHIGRTDPKQIISVSVIVKRKNPLDLGALARAESLAAGIRRTVRGGSGKL